MTQSVRTADRSWRRRIRVASGRVCDRDAGHTLRALQESTAIRRMKRRRSDGYFLRYRHRANVSTNRCHPASRSGLERLPQSLFQLRAIGSADSRSRTVFQDHFKFAMGDRLPVLDAFDRWMFSVLRHSSLVPMRRLLLIAHIEADPTRGETALSWSALRPPCR